MKILIRSLKRASHPTGNNIKLNTIGNLEKYLSLLKRAT
jgi:hypothetical protein